MSLVPEDKLNNIINDDVDKETKNDSTSDPISDSGISNSDANSTTNTPSTDIEISPSKCLEHGEIRSSSRDTEIENDSVLSTPISVSPISNEMVEDIAINKDVSSSEETSNMNIESMSADDVNKSDIVIASHSVEQDFSRSKTQIDENISVFSIHPDAKDAISKKTLTSSTNSLNKDISASIDNNITEKTLSKSAENISSYPNKQMSVNESKEIIVSDEINSDEVLSQFSNQKNKVSAIQKIPEQPQTNVDLRYARLPKELIPQDLGSIVKNVHGIFSSVSGSLKNAYNSSHRYSMQKTPVKTVKPIPNGKMMNYIFEGETNEDLYNETSDNRNQDTNGSLPIEIKSEIENNDSCDVSKEDTLNLQLKNLENLLAEQRNENLAIKEKLKQQSEEFKEKENAYKDMEKKNDLMMKRVEQAEKEKDAAVMRYASVECAGIEARRAADKAIAAERAALADVELMQTKLKSAHGEKQRICQLYDDKCHELSTSEREMAKVREELRELEGRLKWTQSKLRMEMDAYKDSAEKVEKLTQQISELEAAKEAASNNAGDSARAKQLEADLVESQAALILCKHEKQEIEKRLSTAMQQLEICTRERDSATDSLASASAQVEELKISNLRLEEEAAELAALRARAALADALAAQLERESERSSRAENLLSQARAELETCSRREAAALQHAATLTADHVRERASATQRHHQVQALTADNTSLREKILALEEERSSLQSALAEETERRNKENKVLARKVAELTEELAETNKTLEWEKGENCVLKKKHASAIKELNRELQRSLKRCEQLEAKLPCPEANSTRTGSVSSLSSSESAPQEERQQNGHDTSDVQVKEPDRQALIERIVSLQRAAARRAERCEFLEEHSKQLTGELRAKAKLLRHLLCTLPAGAVASQHRDAHKKEIARLGGGAMAAVWGGDPTGMTLELSLEMNKRLQAVLEDALLKNITLKENIDTLGAEISRLKQLQTEKTN